MERIQLWSPDTCECRIHQAIDDSGSVRFVTEAEAEAINEARRNHPDYKDRTRSEPVSSARVCASHSSLGHKQKRHNTLLSENQGKNTVHGELLKIPHLVDVELDEDGNEVPQLKKGVKFDWSFVGKDDKRQLQIELKGGELTLDEKLKVEQAHSHDIKVK